MNRFVKKLLPLCMLMVIAVPVQASAAEKNQINLDALQNNNNCSSNIYKLESFDLNCVQNQTLNTLEKFLEKFPCEIEKLPQDLIKTIKPVNVSANQTKVTAPDAQPKVTAPAEQPKAAKPVEQPKATAPAEQPKTTVQAEQPKTTAPTENASIGTYEQQVVTLVNQERAKQGLSPLTLNTKLSSVAETKAADMRDKNYFSHTSPTYGSPFDMMKQFGISYKSAGENIAMGQKTPESVMNGWMNSEGHRANILNANYTEIGVGYVTDSKGNTYWVQMFIRP
ncbi:MAG: CAP domain-containing protein [Anaerovorax sp.]|nr:CAP domain-containing protein [Anaerovorax sp.]